MLRVILAGTSTGYEPQLSPAGVHGPVVTHGLTHGPMGLAAKRVLLCRIQCTQARPTSLCLPRRCRDFDKIADGNAVYWPECLCSTDDNSVFEALYKDLHRTPCPYLHLLAHSGHK